MVDQNKKIDEYVEISLTPFKKNDGSVILIAADSEIIPLTDADGNLVAALSNYYTKAQTYSQAQVNSLFNNYYTKTESENSFIVTGKANPGPIILKSGSNVTTITPQSLVLQNNDNLSTVTPDTIEFHKDSLTEYNPSYYKVSNSVSSSVVFMTDQDGDFKLRNGSIYVNQISNSPTLAENSDSVLPTQKSIKSYVDAAFSGSVPVTGSSSSFNIDGDITFNNGNTIRGDSDTNKLLFISGSVSSQYTLQGRSSNGDNFGSLILKENETIVENASGSDMMTITPTLTTVAGAIQTPSMSLSTGVDVWEFSTTSFDASGSFTEEQIVPTQAAVRQFVNENAVGIISGGIVGVDEYTVEIAPSGISVDVSGSGTYYGPDRMYIDSTAVETSGTAFFVGVVPAISGSLTTALDINDAAEVKLTSGAYVNEIVDNLDIVATDKQLATAKAIQEYVDDVAGMTTASVIGTSYTVNISAGEAYVGADTDTGPFTVYLPVAPNDGTKVWVKDERNNASNNNITVDGQGNDIDGLTTNIMAADGKGRIYVFSDSQWRIFGI